MSAATRSVLSGLLRGADEIKDRPFAIDVPGGFTGKGRVVLFANNPIYRWQNHGEFNMVFNALLNWNDMSDAPLKRTRLRQVGLRTDRLHLVAHVRRTIARELQQAIVGVLKVLIRIRLEVIALRECTDLLELTGDLPLEPTRLRFRFALRRRTRLTPTPSRQSTAPPRAAYRDSCCGTAAGSTSAATARCR